MASRERDQLSSVAQLVELSENGVAFIFQRQQISHDRWFDRMGRKPSFGLRDGRLQRF